MFRVMQTIVSCDRRAAMLLLATTMAFAAIEVQSNTSDAQEWPCIQRLVPDVSAAVLWPIPITDNVSGRWRDDDELRKYAERWGDIDVVDDEVRENIKQFSENIGEAERTERLTVLADGIVATANDRRKLFIQGIKKYTRQQNAVAKQVEDLLNESERLKTLNDDDSKARWAEVKETLHWHQRVFDQREKAIISLCEQPVDVEQNLGEVLRELAQYLP